MLAGAFLKRRRLYLVLCAPNHTVMYICVHTNTHTHTHKHTRNCPHRFYDIEKANFVFNKNEEQTRYFTERLVNCVRMLLCTGGDLKPLIIPLCLIAHPLCLWFMVKAVCVERILMTLPLLVRGQCYTSRWAVGCF